MSRRSRKGIGTALFTLAILASTCAWADISACANLYVGSILLQKTGSLRCVVFLNNPTDTSGSYCTFFTGWTEDDKKAALAVLLSARMSQQRVDVQTIESGGCSINTAQRDLLNITLSNNP